MSRPFMYFSKKNPNNNQKDQNSCKVLKIEIVNLADLRDETRRDFEGTEAGIQVLLRQQQQQLSSEDLQKEEGNNKNEKDQQEEEDEEISSSSSKQNNNNINVKNFGVCMRLVGEDPDQRGRYIIATGFEREEYSRTHQTMPSPKTQFNDLHVLLLRQKMSTVSEVTMDLKKKLGEYVVKSSSSSQNMDEN